MKKKHALIAGGTGLIGKHLCNLLVNNSEYQTVTSLVRNQSSNKPKNLNEVIVDFNELAKAKLPNDIGDSFDHAFCCLGTTMKKAGSKEAFYKVDFEYVLAFAKLALIHGTKKFLIVTAMGANPKSMFYYNRVKGEIENALKELAFDSLHIFRPSLLLGDRQEERIGESFGKIVSNILNPIIPANYKGIEGKRVAKAMLIQANKKGSSLEIHESGSIQKMT